MKIVNLIERIDVIQFNDCVAKTQLDLKTHLEGKKKLVWRLNGTAILSFVLLLVVYWLNVLSVSVFMFYMIVGGLFITLLGVIQATLGSPVRAQRSAEATVECLLKENVQYHIELTDEEISWTADELKVAISWEDVVGGEYLGGDVVDLWTADDGFFIKLDNLDEETKSEIIKRIRSKMGSRLVNQGTAKSRHYDQLALRQSYIRPFMWLNIVVCLIIGIAGTMIDRMGSESRGTISEGTPMAQVKQTIGRPTAEISGKTYFEEIINSRENQAMKSRNSDMAAFDGLMDMAIIGQRALLEQETAKVLIYDYHDYRFFHLFVDGKYVQGLVPF